MSFSPYTGHKSVNKMTDYVLYIILHKLAHGHSHLHSTNAFVFQSIKDRSCLRYIHKFQHMLASGKFSLTRSGTTANMETPTGSSVITNADQQTVNSPEVI